MKRGESPTWSSMSEASQSGILVPARRSAPPSGGPRPAMPRARGPESLRRSAICARNRRRRLSRFQPIQIQPRTSALAIESARRPRARRSDGAGISTAQRPRGIPGARGLPERSSPAHRSQVTPQADD